MRSFLYVLIISYALLCVLLFVFQRKLLYFPSTSVSHNYQQISVENEDVTIDVIVLRPNQSGAIIYFGGNAESVVLNAEDFLHHFPDRTVYLVNYRGYANSTGAPTQIGLFSDALAIFDKISASHATIAALGRSLGSGVALHLAANRQLDHLVLITPYDSILEIAKTNFRFFPVGLLLKDRYDSLSIANHIRVPTLIIAGAQDNIIPISHSSRLFDAFDPTITQMKTIERAGHNNISEFTEFYKSIGQFLQYLSSE